MEDRRQSLTLVPGVNMDPQISGPYATGNAVDWGMTSGLIAARLPLSRPRGPGNPRGATRLACE